MKCACHSGRTYKECCGPFHAGADAPTPEALMRSRYSAFAMKKLDYVRRTQTVEGEIAPWSARFLDLCILHTSDNEVLFYARIFERGIDRSFVELSTFARREGRWLYESGILLPTEKLPRDPRALTLSEFYAMVE